eukprot:2814223-Rhodomonas_salina.2
MAYLGRAGAMLRKDAHGVLLRLGRTAEQARCQLSSRPLSSFSGRKDLAATCMARSSWWEAQTLAGALPRSFHASQRVSGVSIRGFAVTPRVSAGTNHGPHTSVIGEVETEEGEMMNEKELRFMDTCVKQYQSARQKLEAGEDAEEALG